MSKVKITSLVCAATVAPLHVLPHYVKVYGEAWQNRPSVDSNALANWQIRSACLQEQRVSYKSWMPVTLVKRHDIWEVSLQPHPAGEH